MEDLMKVWAIRSAAYIAGQECPYDEEFDGNDFCATHFLGLINGEPAGALRMRYFADFVKVERLCVLPKFRKSRLFIRLVRTALQHAERKGFRRAYGHARQGLEPMWALFGAKPCGRPPVRFSDYWYTEMSVELTPPPDAIGSNSDGYVIIRPEGEWDRPGVLELSADREARVPDANSVGAG